MAAPSAAKVICLANYGTTSRPFKPKSNQETMLQIVTLREQAAEEVIGDGQPIETNCKMP